MSADYLWEGGPRMDCGGGFALSTDSVLLGNFVNANGVKRGIDLGCGTGILPILLLALHPGLHMTGIEISPEAAGQARANLAENGFNLRSEILTGDIRNCRDLFQSGSFDLVISNPPYFSLGSGTVSPNEARANARGEVNCTLDDVCTAAKYLCRWGGRIAMVYKPDRLTELLTGMSRSGMEPKRLRFVAHRADTPPSLVLVEGKRGGAPGLKVEPLLVLTNEDGSDTEEVKKIYHRQA